MAVSSSMEILLSSQITNRFDSSWVPASDEASPDTPSSRSPSEASTMTEWSNGEVPAGASGSNSPRSRRAAMAMPTAEASPEPKGPVVISTPEVCPTSGWPGVREPQERSALRASSTSPNQDRQSRTYWVNELGPQEKTKRSHPTKDGTAAPRVGPDGEREEATGARRSAV